MNRAYWDNLAQSFESTVFSVLKYDRAKYITHTIKQYGDKNKIAADLGCGIGSFLPALAQHFGKVYAVDISAKCLQRAKTHCNEYDNIIYRDIDLSAGKIKLPKFDFGLSVNALLSPKLEGRIRFIDASLKGLKKHGHFLLVVPSLESVLLANQRLIEWNIKEGTTANQAQRSLLISSEGHTTKKVCVGTVELDGVETKHYLKEEIFIMLERRGMDILSIKKLEYPWDTEFVDPPKWMSSPYPWDWFVLAKKR